MRVVVDHNNGSKTAAPDTGNRFNRKAEIGRGHILIAKTKYRPSLFQNRTRASYVARRALTGDRDGSLPR